MNDLELNKMIVDFSSDLDPTPELKAKRRLRIIQLEETMTPMEKSYGMEEFNVGRVKHHYGSGVYGRELFIPAGHLIVSKIHRGKTLNMIMQGTISVISEMGLHTYKAPYVFVSDPFTKRVVISHEDVIWTTAHGTDKENLEDIEEEIIAKDFTGLDQIGVN